MKGIAGKAGEDKGRVEMDILAGRFNSPFTLCFFDFLSKGKGCSNEVFSDEENEW